MVLRTGKLSGFLRRGSELLDSIMVVGKKEFWKKLSFVFRRGIFWVEYYKNLAGIKLKSYLGFLFSKTSNNAKTSTSVLDRLFSFDVPLITPAESVIHVLPAFI